MTDVKTYEGLPFFIGSGSRVRKEGLANVQDAIGKRTRNISLWYNRYNIGKKIEKSKSDDTYGAITNVNMSFAYNAYFKFLHQSLLSLKDSFRLTSENYKVDTSRPQTILKSYLEALQLQNDLITSDAILYGCASLLLDINIDDDNPTPQILLNRVQSARLVYDFEQPGSAIFSIRITPEVAYKLDFLSETDRNVIYNKAIADAECVANLRVFVGELVVDGKLDNYLALIFQRRVIYAERGRDLTVFRSVSIGDKNEDVSPIYTILKSSEISRDVYKLVFDYNDKVTNPIRYGAWNLDADQWAKAEITKYLKVSPTGGELGTLLPGQLDINGLMTIQGQLQTSSQQATGLNDYTLGESQNSVRTAAEAMMLNDSAAGILNILSNKIKQQLILPCLSDILEIMKVALADVTDIFPEELSIDADIAKDQQEANILMSLINMPMFGAVIQGLNNVEAIQMFRWILEKLHISGTSSVFDDMLQNAIENQSQQQNNMRSKQ